MCYGVCGVVIAVESCKGCDGRGVGRREAHEPDDAVRQVRHHTRRTDTRETEVPHTTPLHQHTIYDAQTLTVLIRAITNVLLIMLHVYVDVCM